MKTLSKLPRPSVLSWFALLGMVGTQACSDSVELEADPEPKAELDRPDAARPPTSDGGAPAPAKSAEEVLRDAQKNLAKNLKLESIAVFQGVKVVIAKDGAAFKPKIPVLANRPGALRVYVAPEAAYAATDVTCTLFVKGPGKALESRTLTQRMTQRSSDEDPSSSFTFDLSSEDMATGVEYRVALTSAQGSAEASSARFPKEDAFTSFSVSAESAVLRIVLVPYRYTADGSNRLPDTSQAGLDRYANGLRALYPVGKVEIVLHAPVSYTSAIRSDQSWEKFLDKLAALRAAEKPAKDVYYYGLVAPAANAASYQGSTLGLGFQAALDQPEGRAAVGVQLDTTDESLNTLAHELGHLHGQAHAPCGDTGTDTNDPTYPSTGAYAQGSIGSWGYDMRSKKFVSPGAKDFMGYCPNQWVSDYNFEKFFARASSLGRVSLQAQPVAAASEPYRMIRVDSTGKLFDEGALSLEPSAFATETVTVREGPEERLVQATFLRYDHAPGGVLLVPTGTSTSMSHSVSYQGRTLSY
jgi:hypothetical protein